MYVCLFFFFKQKTAYELRISDWSSDVCSSDLLPLLVPLLFPASLWLSSWRALALWKRPAEPGLRFGLIVSLIGLVVFSLISGKQPHYLLPLMPALMLMVARGLNAEWRGLPRRRGSPEEVVAERKRGV